jgi:hypothetical protein
MTTPSHRPRGFRVPVQILIMTMAGALVFFFFEHRLIGAVIWLLALALLLGFLFSPAIVRGFERFGAWLGRFVGTALTYILLVPMFYIVFTFGRIMITILGRDPLDRKWRPQADSYWEDRAKIESTAHFSRQY